MCCFEVPSYRFKEIMAISNYLSALGFFGNERNILFFSMREDNFKADCFCFLTFFISNCFCFLLCHSLFWLSGSKVCSDQHLTSCCCFFCSLRDPWSFAVEANKKQNLTVHGCSRSSREKVHVFVIELIRKPTREVRSSQCKNIGNSTIFEWERSLLWFYRCGIKISHKGISHSCNQIKN